MEKGGREGRREVHRISDILSGYTTHSANPCDHQSGRSHKSMASKFLLMFIRQV
jgi:hypothetical protein